jgi:MFS family permease
MFVDHGMSLNDIALLLGTVGFVAGLVGAGLGGYAATRFGRKRALVGCGVFQVLSIAGYIPAAMGIGGAASLAVASTVEHLAGGMATVALFTMMMDASGEETAATDYTVQACVVVGATGVCSLLSGPIAQAVGYPIHFVISAVVAVVGVVVAAVAFARGSLPPPTPPRSSSLSG